MNPEDQGTIVRSLQQEAEALRIIEGWIVRAASPFRQRLAAQRKAPWLELDVVEVREQFAGTRAASHAVTFLAQPSLT